MACEYLQLVHLQQQIGTEPTKWQGSILILQKYWETKSPVKFGQCWVFSGVTTTGKLLK